ncbi:hypothetical protein [Thermoactinospora rubra]|uniref:hypothetical protein n=1 Tax=Thermoactinospora rubra TaxID=1088767 RepID=UPI000A11ADEC|nr:hypothetical protein [Thermoactinospora rubra]
MRTVLKLAVTAAALSASLVAVAGPAHADPAPGGPLPVGGLLGQPGSSGKPSPFDVLGNVVKSLPLKGLG